MDMAPEIQDNPDQAPERPAAHDLVMRILKLRWIRLDEEAENAHVALQKVEPEATVLPGPVDTD
jgi:hypothetical protein